MNASFYTYAIAFGTAAGIVARPFRWPEAVWAVFGALAVLALGLLPPTEVWSGIIKGYDVYLFLIGMMLLSEVARHEGLFDWMAAIATSGAKGSPYRLFVLIYVIGTLVTVLLSNDATAVVLTPAVYAACKAAKVKNPLPYLLICAFIANAASFVLPISNPANLVVFAGGDMPSLYRWMAIFSLPSLVAIIATFFTLYWTQRTTLLLDLVASHVERPVLSLPAKFAGVGLAVTATMLVAMSALHRDLGLPTFVAGILTSAFVLLASRQSPVPIIRGVTWSVLPLVGGLFVIVEAINHTGLTAVLSSKLSVLSAHSESSAVWLSGISVAIISNIINNLPAGLFAGSTIATAHVSDRIAGAVLIGVDLGPNLSVTGSLATILWLAALRREGIDVSAFAFLKLGALVMLPALLLALATLCYF